jgi:hypothetical protein
VVQSVADSQVMASRFSLSHVHVSPDTHWNLGDGGISSGTAPVPVAAISCVNNGFPATMREPAPKATNRIQVY